MRKHRGMQTISDFCAWLKSQRRAAELLGVSETTVSRMVNGHQPVTPAIAEQIERVSGGLFRKERVLWPDASETDDKAA